jgi:predicted Rossmann fold nucleotide-binding protein DprA/Smf involved in DNA uptake
MENKKMTKATAWTIVRSIVENSGHAQSAELVAKIDNELALLAKKNSAEKKPTAQQTANEVVKTAILNGMERNRIYTVTEVIKEIPECAELTNQRVSALLRQLKDEGKVIRTEDKRKAYFQVV